MRNKKFFYKMMGCIVMFALLLAASPWSPAVAAAIEVGPALQSGADRLVAVQNNDGGWDWGSADDGNPDSTSPVNTIGPIGKGLAEAYGVTGDLTHEAALAEVGALLLTKTNNFSPSDGYLAVALDDVFGGSTYQDHVVANFYAPLAAGTYDRNGAGTLYTTASYVQLVRDARASLGDLGVWDLGIGLVGAQSCGADTSAWIAGVEAEIEEMDTSNSYHVLGLTGAVYGLAFAGADYDPIAGSYASAGSVADLAEILASYQIDNGGIAWSPDYVIPDDGNETIQETAYAILALNEVDREAYFSNIIGAADYMMSVQLASGGWENYAGDGENNEITGEALWALNVAYPQLWVCETGACEHPGAQYSSIQEAIENIGWGGRIYVAAGDYIEEGQIVIDKNLTIIGEDKTSTIIMPDQNTGSSGDTRGWFLVHSGIEFNLSNVTLDGSGWNIYQAIRSYGTGTIDNNIIKNISYPGYMGVGIAVMDANMVISHNNFENIGRIGVILFGSGVTNGVIDNNAYVGKGAGDWLDYGIELGGGAVAEITYNDISNCLGIASSDGSTSGAVLITTYFGGGTAGTIEHNVFTGNSTAILVGYDESDTSAVTAKYNQFVNNELGISTTAPFVDASPNWWGSMGGPLDSQIDGDVDYIQWCGDEGCTFFVPDENGVITLSGEINVPGGIEINQPDLTFLLLDGTVIENNSPCFIINADFTTITTESPLGAVCLPTGGSNAIDVNGDRTNIVIEGLEIDGAAGTNGIDFDGVVTDLVIRDNYIHGLAGDGLFFGYQPEGTIQIQGNLFMDNGGKGIEAGAFAVPAEFNAWGSYAGPAVADGGDGISDYVDADPWTHVDLYLEPSGTDYPGSVYLGEQITFEVRANLVNVMGVDFVLEIPDELSVVGAVPGGQFDNESLTPVAGGYYFVTYQMGSAALTGEDLVLFTVTLEGASAGKPLTLNIDELSDVFSMAPGFGPSTNIYAADLTDYTDAEVNAYPTMDIVPSGAYIAGLPIEFSVDIDNANGDDFASVGLSFSLPAGAILEYWDGSAWFEISVDPFVLGTLAGDAAPSVPFRVLFVDAGTNVVSVDLYDLTPNTLLASASETFETLGDFNVTGTISMQGRSVRSGVPMKLASMIQPYYSDNDIFSSNEISNNILFAGVNGGLYNISTSQPRYLNVSAEMRRTLDITGDLVLPDLELKGGNADWTDNVVDISDAGIVGGEYGTGGLEDNGDVNFDDRVNIQDLALVGGNFDLTSEEAYAGWPGFTEVSGTFVIDEGTGLFTADMTGAYSLHIEGQGLPAGPNLTSFTGNVTGDISGTVEGMINAQGMDILYAVITPASGDPVRLYGTLLGDFEGWLVSGPERNPVNVAEITGLATVEVGSMIDLAVLLDGDAPDRPVLWSVYVDDSAIAEIDLYSGELTGLSAGTATVIVTVLDDGNVSFDTYSVTVTAP